MKKALSLIVLALATVFAAPVYAQSPNQPSLPALWTVAGAGCPAAAGLPATLAPQWTTALAAVNGNALETSEVQFWQTYVATRIAQYLAQNPQQNITVRVSKPSATSGIVVQAFISSIALPAAASCPAS